MQNFLETEELRPIVWIDKIEDIPGGVVVAVADLTQDHVDAGTPIGEDVNGLFHVVKTAEMYDDATDSATDYPVKKGHNFKVGDYFTNGLLKAAHAITAIVTTEDDYDTISLGTTLGEALAEGDIVFEALADSASTSAFKYTPKALTGFAFDIVEDDNHFVDAIRIGSLYESLAPPIHASIKTALPLIIFQ